MGLDISSILWFILAVLYFMLPAYMANMAPVIMKGTCKSIARPIDFGTKLRGKPLFGKNKTWRGLFFGVLFGIAVAYIQYQIQIRSHPSFAIIDYSNWLLFGTLMGLGAILGDMVESTIKRQFDYPPGKPFIPWDQTDFVFGSLILSIWFLPADLRLTYFISILIISPFLHIATNHLAFYLRIRNEKW